MIIGNLLSEKEILDIQVIAENKIYSIPDLLHFSYKNPLSIAKISQNKGLILIYGNSETGLKHINERHIQTYGNLKLTNGEITNPGIFSSENFIGFNDYLIIAEEIYNLNNKIIDNNEKSKFDRYDGEFKKVKYRLILYKNSKIIHTLFPTKTNSKEHEKIKIKFILGKIGGIFDLVNDNYTVEVPFLDKNKTKRYVFHFRLRIDLLIEELWIELYNRTGQPYVTYLIGKRVSKEGSTGEKLFDSVYHLFRKGNGLEFEKILDKLERRGVQQIESIIEEFNKNRHYPTKCVNRKIINYSILTSRQK